MGSLGVVHGATRLRELLPPVSPGRDDDTRTMSDAATPKRRDDGAPDAELPGIDRLLEVMARLRDPAGGCPWDLEQNFETIAPYTIEEAYEVAEAIRQDDRAALRDELGDLLLQVVFHAQMAQEDGSFDFDEVARCIANKMIRRHPNVFGDDESDARHSAPAQMRSWEAQKAAERDAKALAEGRRPSVLDGVALALPALLRAEKLQKRAARVGFDWPDERPVFDKVLEEVAELREAASATASPNAADASVKEEVGDLLFACVNLARHVGVDPEGALRAANAKFTARFHRVEAALAGSGHDADKVGLAELDRLWEEAKKAERRSSADPGPTGPVKSKTQGE